MNKAYIAQLRPHVKRVHALLDNSENSDDMKALAILNILMSNWESEVKITQQALANQATQVHMLWEGHQSASNDSVLRKVRSLIEKKLRKKHNLPILSTPGKGDGNAGYWLVRDRHEAVEYVERRESEIESMVESAQVTLATVRRVCQIDREVKSQLNDQHVADALYKAYCLQLGLEPVSWKTMRATDKKQTDAWIAVAQKAFSLECHS